MEEAARREGHADNVAACWLGGFAVSQWQKMPPSHTQNGGPPMVAVRDLGLYACKGNIKKAWPLLLGVPRQALSTEEPRPVPPAGFSRFETWRNLQPAMPPPSPLPHAPS